MNISTNYSVMNSYFNLRMKNQEETVDNSAPAFKRTAEKVVNKGLFSAALGAYFGIKTIADLKSQEKQEVTLDSIKESLNGGTTLDNVNDVKEIVYNHPEVVNRLLEIKNPDGSQYFDEFEVVFYVLSPNSEVLLTEPEKVFAVLENPQEMSALRTKEYNTFNASMLNWAINHPLDSTREANPNLFEPEKAITVESVKNVLEKNANSDSTHSVLKALDTNPEVVEKLASLKDSAGHQFVDLDGVANFLGNMSKRLEQEKQIDKLNRFLDDTDALGYAEICMNRSNGLWNGFLDYE